MLTRFRGSRFRHPLPVQPLGIRIEEHDDDGHRVMNPIVNMRVVRPKDNRLGGLLRNVAPTGLDLKGDELPRGPPVLDDLDMRVDAVIEGMLLPEEPPILREE